MENSEHVIGVDAMAHETRKCCIYRVPFDLRTLNENAYTPKVVSIGPFHHNTLPRLFNMERHKRSYCNAFLQRTQTTSDTWIRYIQSVEPEFRLCYSETLHFSKEEMITRIMENGERVIDIEAEVQKAEAPVTPECCIYRVPFEIRRVNENAYTPNVVSIGPYHHKTLPRLLNMQRHKLYYCKTVLERTRTASASWIQFIGKMEPQIRCCYSDTLNFSTEELVQTIFVDSGFILELFLRCHEAERKGSWSSDDVCLSKPWLRTSIRQDMLLLENQVPFFVLHNLYARFFTTTSNEGDNNNNIIQLAIQYFDSYNHSKLEFDNEISISHFTDLIRTFHPPPPKPNRQLSDATGLSEPDVVKELEAQLPSVTELSEAGMKFEVSENKYLVDLKFEKPVLKIPKLIVDDVTEILFRNMVALEQCHYQGDQSHISDYVQIMDFLVNTSTDVDFLVRKRILINLLGDSNSVAKLFNGLCNNILVPDDSSSSYSGLLKELNGFYQNRWNKWKWTLRHEYCKDPWKIAGTTAAILLLTLALVQTICSVLQVKLQ
ncbi:hypothetical protein Fmac_000778 [Flemingia macrophylla]|uniref:Uncharacterized protein n=1 Tax=Flemingia macrophylla TaxID=520843 RepID=A0ABD1NFW2_9FABA